MIKFFRKIRQNALSNGKTEKYLLYAIGEIVLVVIGILIALNINNWNENKKLSKKEMALLETLKNDIELDILALKHEDSMYSWRESHAKSSVELFYKARTIRDLDTVHATTKAHWNELYINQNTYTEMIGSGSLYSIKNKTLKQSITAYYLQVEADRMYFRDVNKIQSHLWEVSPEIHPYKYLIGVPEYHEVDKASIDTTWINNPNSPTYLGVLNYLQSNYHINNVYRRSVFKRTLTAAHRLTVAIDAELQSQTD